MKSVHSAIGEFLRGQDQNDRARAVAVIMQAFDEHANSFPGPDAFMKRKIKPHVEEFAKSLINDLFDYQG